MKTYVPLLLLASLLSIATRPAPVETVEQAREAAKLVVVEKIEKTLPNPDTEQAAFIKQCWDTGKGPDIPLTTTDWRAKWDLFAERLTAKAKDQGLDQVSLGRCLQALNHGALLHNSPTRLESLHSEVPRETIEKPEPNTQPEPVEISGFPLGHLLNLPACVPTAAFLVRYPKGTCWLILAYWEYDDINPEALPLKPGTTAAVNVGLSLSHVRFWVMDTATCEVLLYQSCD
jgi:hypothetical protein